MELTQSATICLFLNRPHSTYQSAGSRGPFALPDRQGESLQMLDFGNFIFLGGWQQVAPLRQVCTAVGGAL